MIQGQIVISSISRRFFRNLMDRPGIIPGPDLAAAGIYIASSNIYLTIIL